MIRTVDLVVAGDGMNARAEAISALQRGERVLVVLRSGDAKVTRSLRRAVVGEAGADGGQLSVITGAEVVCADGIDGVEAVVVRYMSTGRLSAVNASRFVSAARAVTIHDASPAAGGIEPFPGGASVTTTPRQNAT